MSETEDPELVSLLKALAKRVHEEQLSGELYSSDYILIIGNPEAGIFQYDTEESTFLAQPPYPNVRVDEVEEYEETKELSTYLNAEYGLDIHQPAVSKLLNRIFGPELEYLEGYEERIDDIAEKVIADADHPRYNIKSFIFGLEIDDFQLNIQSMKLRELREDDVTERIHHIHELLPNMQGTRLTKELLDSSILEFSTTDHDSLDAQREAYNKVNLVVSLLNLYLDSNYFRLRTEKQGRFFWTGSTSSSLTRKITAESRFQLVESDEEHLNQLHELISGFWYDDYNEGDTGSFNYPVSVAYHSLQRAWEVKGKRRESIGWLVIALEAFFGSGKGRVSTYVAILLSSAGQLFDPIQVRDDVSAAFEERHSWAHGGSIKRGNVDDFQARLRDYVRVTIILFCYMVDNGAVATFDEVIEIIEDSVVDEEERDELDDHFSGIDISELLRIDPELHSF